MHTEAVHLAVDSGFEAIMPHDVAVHRSRIERPIQLFGRAVVFDRAEQRPAAVRAMPGESQVFFDEPLRRGVNGNKPHLVALALDPEMPHTLTALHVLNPEPA